MLVASRILREYGVRVCHYIPEGPSKAARAILEELGVELEPCQPEGAGLIIVVDSSNPAQLGALGGKLEGSKIILVDHHSPGGLMEIADLPIVDPEAASTSELIGVLAATLGVRLNDKEASAGLTGIAYDTRRFRIIGAYTFDAASYYSSQGGRIIEPPSEEIGFSERYARVKAASRARVARICKELILAVTHVGSYESSAARALLDVGADIVVVVAGSGRARRISVRVSGRAVSSGVAADELARFIAEKLGGEGGGHAQAAMVHLPEEGGDPSNIAEELARSLQGKAARLCVRGRETRG